MSDIDKIIKEMFSSQWHGHLSSGSIEDMRKELLKNLQDQVNGFWSGHTAYSIMVDGGFLVDSKRVRLTASNMCEGKRLTMLGEMFVESMTAEIEGKA